MKLNNITQNNESIESLSKTANYRIPDEMIKDGVFIRQIGEVKHYSMGRTVNLTPQLKYFIQYADKNQVWFQLYIPKGVNISSPLQNLLNQSQYSRPIFWY